MESAIMPATIAYEYLTSAHCRPLSPTLLTAANFLPLAQPQAGSRLPRHDRRSNAMYVGVRQ